MAGKKRTPPTPTPPAYVDKAELAVMEAIRLESNRSHPIHNPESTYRAYDTEPSEERSSIPLEGFKEQTEGRQPRSRLAETREAGMHSKEEEIEYFSQNLGKTAGDRLAIAKGMIPSGYTPLWARASVRDRPDIANLRMLKDKGWRYATADEIPGLAYHDHFHGIRDDAEHIYNSGLVLMLRYEELTKRELAIFKQNSDNQTRALTQKYRSENKDLHPFAINERDNYQDPFLTHHPVGTDFRTSLSDF